MFGIVKGEKTKLDITPGSELTPVIIDTRTLVPIRFLSANFDADVIWWGKTIVGREDTDITLNGKTVNVMPGRDTMIVNGTTEIKLEVPTRYINGTTFVPMRAVLEELGLFVAYDKFTYSIVVSDKFITDEILAEQVEIANQKLGISPNLIAVDYILLNTSTKNGLYLGAEVKGGAPVQNGEVYVHAWKLEAFIGGTLAPVGNVLTLKAGLESMQLDLSNTLRDSKNELYIKLSAATAKFGDLNSKVNDGITIVSWKNAPDAPTTTILTTVGKRALGN